MPPVYRCGGPCGKMVTPWGMEESRFPAGLGLGSAPRAAGTGSLTACCLPKAREQCQQQQDRYSMLSGAWVVLSFLSGIGVKKLR